MTINQFCFVIDNEGEQLSPTTAMYFDINQVNIQTEFKHWKRVNAKKCKLINRPNNIMWLCNL